MNNYVPHYNENVSKFIEYCFFAVNIALYQESRYLFFYYHYAQIL